MAKNKGSKAKMDEALVSNGDNGRLAAKEILSFAGILATLSTVLSFLKTLILEAIGVTGTLENIIGTVLAFVLSIISSILTKFLLEYVTNKRRNKWIKENKKVWVGGVWLHTHVKENGAIRVGYVVIQQYFDLVKAKGHNVSLGKDPNKKKWEYLTGKVFPKAEDDNDLVCVFSNRKHGRIENTGTHVFKVIQGKDGFPLRLEGEFKDTISDDLKKPLLEASSEEKALFGKLGEHYGSVFLFKPSEELLARITEEGAKEPSLDLIRKFVLKEDGLNEGFENDPFSKGLEGALKKSQEKKEMYQ